jgi:F-type H+-transporting ATPase subunit b
LEKLGINFPLLIAQIVNVVLLVWLLSMFLYRPILNMLNERTRRIQESLKDAEQVKEQLARANQDYDAKLAQARQEAAAILAQAQERAKLQEQEIVAQARVEADRIRSDAREQAVQERDQLLRDLKNQMAELVTATASRVLGEELKSNHDKLIADSLASLGRQN